MTLRNRRKSPFTSFVLFLALSTTIAGCGFVTSFFEDAPQTAEESAPQSEDPKQPAPQREQKVTAPPKQGTEIVWIVPSEPVDGFIVRYGPSKDALTQEVRIKTDELRTSSDATYGQVYRYVLQGIENMSPVFVSIASFKGDQVSEFSAVMEEKP